MHFQNRAFGSSLHFITAVHFTMYANPYAATGIHGLTLQVNIISIIYTVALCKYDYKYWIDVKGSDHMRHVQILLQGGTISMIYCNPITDPRD